jgi:hypothetical protein
MSITAIALRQAGVPGQPATSTVGSALTDPCCSLMSREQRSMFAGVLKVAPLSRMER